MKLPSLPELAEACAHDGDGKEGANRLVRSHHNGS